MRKIIIVLIMIVLVGCSNNYDQIDNKLSIKENLPTATSTLLIKDFDAGEDNSVRVTSYLKVDSILVKQWEELFLKNFNISLNYSSYNNYYAEKGVLFYPISPYDHTEEIKLSMNNQGGLYIISIYDFLRFENEKKTLLLPFNDLKIERLLDSKITNPLSDNSEVWALPCHVIVPTLFVREYNKDMLDSLNMSLPTNLTQLFEILLAARKSNSINYIINIPGGVGIGITLFDVFAAFDINTDFFPVKYDEKVKGYIDPLASQNMKDCIEYLTQLADNDILQFDGYEYEINVDDMFSKSKTYQIGSKYTVNLDNDLHEYKTFFYYNQFSYVYVLAKNTKNIESVDNYLDVIYNTSIGYLTARYGHLDEYTVIDNKVYVRDIKKERLGLIGDLPTMNYFEVSNTGTEEDTNEEISIINELFKSNYYYPVSISEMNYLNFEANQVIALNFKNSLYNYLSNKDRESVDDFIYNYMVVAKKNNTDDTINELNNKNNTGYEFSYWSYE